MTGPCMCGALDCSACYGSAAYDPDGDYCEDCGQDRDQPKGCQCDRDYAADVAYDHFKDEGF